MTTILERPTARPPASPADDRSAVTASIIAQFRSALRELKCMGGDRMRRTGLSFGTSHIIGMLDRHGDMPMSRLADLLDVSLSNASGIVDRLEEHGLVERVRVPADRRIVLVSLTDSGRTALAQVDVLHDELMQSILARLDDRRLRRVAAALDDIRQAAGDALADDPELARHQLTHHTDDPPTVPASHA
jgi:DNA-binding MarR family transcriptional regulator